MRTEIKNKIIECLKGKTLAGDNVHFMRRGSKGSPFLSLFYDNEKVKISTISPPETSRELNFTIESFFEGDSKQVELFYDLIVDQIETAMNNLRDDTSFDLIYKGSRYDVESESKTLALLALDYSVSYIKEEKTEIKLEDINKFKLIAGGEEENE